VKSNELREEIIVELEAMEMTVNELVALHQDVANREPTIREITAAAAFLAQFYSGLENILKRMSVFHGIPLPTAETWHVELFQRFSHPALPGLPLLFNEPLASTLAPYRRFRHVAFHSYSFQLDWQRMIEGVENVDRVFEQVKDSLFRYLDTIDA
jgi:hypothetical protein